MYRTLQYINSNGDSVELSVPFESFLYELSGMGFSYENEITENNYVDVLTVASSRLVSQPISGRLSISNLNNDNADIYDIEKSIATVLNYDQLIRKVTGQNAIGKLIYENADSLEVYTPVLIKEFKFGEIEEEEGHRFLNVDIQFDRLSKVWLVTAPTELVVNMVGDEYAHYHSFSHPYTHGSVKIDGSGKIMPIGGNDLAKFNIKINGEVSAFSISFTNIDKEIEQVIRFKRDLLDGQTLIIDNFGKSSYIKGTGINGTENAIPFFDLVEYDIPFFDLLPNCGYEIKVDAEVLRGSIHLEIYESWVSAP